MIKKTSRAEVRQKKHRRMRNNIAGTASKPRLSVFRSNNHMYAQIIDDSTGSCMTLFSAGGYYPPLHTWDFLQHTICKRLPCGGQALFFRL
ncbi:MAG: hypothetical protein IJI53_13390 [Clostridia bacterium]|nr:hypothetical protein [Clostridia bacterium]